MKTCSAALSSDMQTENRHPPPLVREIRMLKRNGLQTSRADGARQDPAVASWMEGRISPLDSIIDVDDALRCV